MANDGSVRIDIIADDADVKKKLDETAKAAKEAGDKYTELTATIAKQEMQLKALRDGYTEAVLTFGKNSKEAKGLKEEMLKFNSALENNKARLANAENAAKGLSGALNNVEKSAGTTEIAIGSFVGNALSNLAGKIMETVGNIASLADETREYREDMAKLDTAFTSAGHSTETASAAYDSFYKILGESDRSVEAVNHLAELTKNEQEVAQWGTIAAGVTARFGDSLPIEGLTEAANETAKVGQVTGPLADALNWAGISEDEFNKKLAACNSEQERASLITSTLNGEYAAAAEEYNKLTANTQAARDATNNMEQAQAALGAAIEPVTTAWTNLKAQGMQWLVDTGLPALQTGWQWVLDNIPVVAVIVAGLTAAWLAFGGAQTIVTTATTLMTAAQTALNVVMSANIGLIILAITALVAAFMLLWKNSESFRNFWIGLWDGIKKAALAVVEWLKVAFSIAWDAIKNAWGSTKEFFSNIWDGIVKVFSVVGDWFKDKFSQAWNGIKVVWDTVKGYFQLVWDNIKLIFSVVKSVLTGDFQGAWDGIKAIWGNAKAFFDETWEKIKSAFNIGDMTEIGSNLLKGIWNGINDTIGWLKSKVKGVVDKIKSWFTSKDGFDEHSPSKWAKQVAIDVNRGQGEGFVASADIPVKEAAKVVERIKATVAAENSRMGQGVGTTDTGYSEIARAVGMQTAGINSLASEYRRGSNAQVTVPLIIDGRELGRAIVDLGNTENIRTGTSLVTE